MSKTYLVLTSLAASAFVAAPAYSSSYQGHGAESVPAETLRKFAPPPLPSEVSRRIQSMLDIRAPGMGMVSPDGKRLYFGWTVTGTPQVWRLDGPKAFPVQMTGGEDPTALTGITPDGKWLILSRDRKGEENPGLYLQPSGGGALKEIQHKAKVQTSLQFVTDDSKWLYYRANDVKTDSYALYRYEIATGKSERIFDQDGIWSIADFRDADELLLQKATGSLSSELFTYRVSTHELKPLLGQGEKTEWEAQFGPKKGELFVQTNKFGDFRRLYRWSARPGIDPASEKSFSPITGALKMDVSGFTLDRPRRRLYYAVNDQGYTRVRVADARTLKPVKLPEFKGADHMYFGSITRNGRYVTLGVETAKAPRSSFVLDWTSGALVQWVVPSSPEVDTRRFVAAQLESYPARDGAQIPMFSWVPEKCRNLPAGVEPCPVLVSFHGGPEGQATPGFTPVYQALLDAGFVLLEPNVRGSDGYGKAYLDADNGPKRLDVITDIEDAGRHARKAFSNGDKAPKVGIFGGSYGGYSTLYGMTRFAGTFDAGVAIVGMSNLMTFLQNTAPYRRILRISEYGDPDKDKEALLKLSPVTYLKQVRAPLMIIQGVTDPRVPAGEAIQMHEALVGAKIPSELILFGDEGHGVQKRENRVLMWGHLVQFFEKHLKTGVEAKPKP